MIGWKGVVRRFTCCGGSFICRIDEKQQGPSEAVYAKAWSSPGSVLGSSQPFYGEQEVQPGRRIDGSEPTDANRTGKGIICYNQYLGQINLLSNETGHYANGEKQMRLTTLHSLYFQPAIH